MSTKDDGGPAFPLGGTTDGGSFEWRGMSLRDYFAGQALAAIDWRQTTKDTVAQSCYAMADAMLKAREK